MFTLENLLSPLCMAIREKTYKSKQAAFNVYLDQILMAKEHYSWVQIADYLNTSTNTNVDSISYKNMTDRAKKKCKNIKNKKDPVTPEKEKSDTDTTGKFFTSREEITVKHDSTASMDKFKEKYL